MTARFFRTAACKAPTIDQDSTTELKLRPPGQFPQPQLPELDAVLNSSTMQVDSLRHIIVRLGFGAHESPYLSTRGARAGGPALAG
jgi:hypothetical protein